MTTDEQLKSIFEKAWDINTPFGKEEVDTMMKIVSGFSEEQKQKLIDVSTENNLDGSNIILACDYIEDGEEVEFES